MAIDVVQEHKGNITMASQLAIYVSKKGKLTQTVLMFIEKILHGIDPKIASSGGRGRGGGGPPVKEYVPRYRSGAYAILLALDESPHQTLTKHAILPITNKLCDASMYQADISGRTAWNSIKTLEKPPQQYYEL
jgi:hypothetical protein